MDNFIITIGREYGSGGKYIGEELAKKLNIKFYDKELLRRVSEENDVDINLLEEVDEKQKSSFWYTLAMASYSSTDSVNSLTQLPPNEQYFIEQAKLIEKIAETESAVIIGRCSNIILKDKPNVTNIFIYATDIDFKINRKSELEQISKKQAEKLINKKDKERSTYYNYYTNEKWGDRTGYNLCLDTSKIGIENTIKIIEQYIKMST